MKKHQTIISLLLCCFAISALTGNDVSREIWRLHTYELDMSFSHSYTIDTDLYIYNTQYPMLVDYVQRHRISWGEGEPYTYDFTIPYVSSIQYLTDRYVVQQSYSQFMEVIEKDFEDKYLKKTVYLNSTLYSRSEWLYNNLGKQYEAVYYRNPEYFFHLNGYWKVITDYDSIGIKSCVTKYYSSDSLSWTPKYRLIHHAGLATLPVTYMIEERSPYWQKNHFWFSDILNNAVIDSITVQAYQNNMWNRLTKLDFSYVDYGTYIGITMADHVFLEMLFEMGGYLEYASFFPNGLIKYYAIVDEFNFPHILPRTHEFTWIDENTSMADETAPQAISDVEIYPNPFSLDLKINLSTNNLGNVSIYNIKGQLIKNWKNLNNKGIVWNGKDKNNQFVAKGVYIISINCGNSIITRKVMKLK